MLGTWPPSSDPPERMLDKRARVIGRRVGRGGQGTDSISAIDPHGVEISSGTKNELPGVGGGFVCGFRGWHGGWRNRKCAHTRAVPGRTRHPWCVSEG